MKLTLTLTAIAFAVMLVTFFVSFDSCAIVSVFKSVAIFGFTGSVYSLGKIS